MIFMYIPIILIGLYECNIIKNKDDTMNILNSYNTNNIKGKHIYSNYSKCIFCNIIFVYINKNKIG